MAITIKLKSGEVINPKTTTQNAVATPNINLPKTSSGGISIQLKSGATINPTVPKTATVPVATSKKQNLLSSAFDQNENYYQKFKKGDIVGGVANLAGGILTSAQSTYLNLANQLASVAQGKGLQPIKYQMSFADYEKAVANRAGVKPISENIKSQSPLLGSIYSLAMEIGTDPLELTPIGFLNDIKAAKGIGTQTTKGLEKISAKQPLFKSLDTETTLPQGTSEALIKPVSDLNPPSVTMTPANIVKGKKGVVNIEPTLKAQEKIVDNPLKSFEDKISYGKKKERLSFSEWNEKARVQLTDRLASLERLEKQVKGKVGDATNSLYKQARLFAGVPEQASGRIEFGLKPIIKSVEEAGYKYNELGNYAEAVHARDVNALGIDSGFTNQEIESIIKKYGDDPIIENARLALLKYNDDLIQTLADSGRISSVSLEAMRTKFPNYMPLNRQLDDVSQEFGVSLKEKFSNPSQPIKSLKGLKGKEAQTIDPIESMVSNTYKLLTSAAQNDVGRQIKELSNIDVDSNFIRKLEEGEKVNRKNIISVYEDGIKTQYEVDRNVYEAMEGLNKISSNILMHILSAPASVLRAGATLTPEFAVRNPMRDVVQAYVTTGFNPITDFMRGLSSYLKKDDMYQRFLESKGAFGNLTSYDRTSNRKILKDIIKKPVTSKFITVIDPRTSVELLRRISDATESATKLGMFKKGIKEGMTDAESAYQARDLMDFARAGSVTKEANKAVAFLNANIQGKSKIYRAIKDDPKGVTARMFKALVVPAITVKALQYTLSNETQKKQIEDAPDWLKDSFYLIPIPDTNLIARIPKPFDLAIVANTTERFMDYFAKDDPTAFDGFISDTLRNQTVPLIPTAIMPLIEAWSGKSSFRNAPIVPMREQNLPLEMQTDINISELSKLAASGARKLIPSDSKFSALGSPRVMENTIKGYTAGLGQYTMDIYDFISNKVTNPEVKKAEKTISQKPIARAFLVNEMSTGKPMDYVYSEYNKLNIKNEGTPLTGTEKETYDALLNYKNAISAVSKEMRTIQNSSEYTPKEKLLLLEDLSNTRNSFAKEAYDVFKRNKPAEDFFSKYNLTESQVKKMPIAKAKGLTEKQIVDAFAIMKGNTKNIDKLNAIKTLPYDDATKNKLFFTLVKGGN